MLIGIAGLIGRTLLGTSNGTTGSLGGGVRPSISSSSVWQTPQTETLSRTSPGPGMGTGSSTSRSGAEFSDKRPSRSRSIAFMATKN